MFSNLKNRPIIGASPELAYSMTDTYACSLICRVVKVAIIEQNNEVSNDNVKATWQSERVFAVERKSYGELLLEPGGGRLFSVKKL